MAMRRKDATNTPLNTNMGDGLSDTHELEVPYDVRERMSRERKKKKKKPNEKRASVGTKKIAAEE